MHEGNINPDMAKLVVAPFKTRKVAPWRQWMVFMRKVSEGSTNVAVRVLAFDRETEGLAMEFELAPVPLTELRRLAGLPDDFDTAIGQTEIRKEHLSKIREWIDQVLDFDQFDIFFEEARLEKYFETKSD